jgi:hypothetical protein
MDNDKPLYVSPSNLAFVFTECKACYYNEVHGICRRPRTPMPSIFNRIDGAMKRDLLGADPSVEKWIDLEGAPARFRIVRSDERVTSAADYVGETGLRIAIRGNLDTRVEFEDGAAGIIDLKAAAVKPHLIGEYSNQLHAYKYGKENPLKGDAMRIDRLGLLVFEPGDFRFVPEHGRAYLAGEYRYLPIPVDADGFEEFLFGNVGALLALPEAPPPSPGCDYCHYQLTYHRNQIKVVQIDRPDAQLEDIKRESPLRLAM